MKKDDKYDELKALLDSYKNDLVVGYVLQDIYLDENKKITIRYTIGSNERTLTQEDIQGFNDSIIAYIEKKYNIIK
jgi:phenylalanyl-tRNA synthetase beta chain